METVQDAGPTDPEIRRRRDGDDPRSARPHEGLSLARVRAQAAAAREWLDPARATRVLVVVHVLAVTWVSAGGGLFIDDLRAQAYAAGRPIWPFVVESNRTHLAPGARTVDWVMAHAAPLEHWPAVALTVVIATLYAVTAARLLDQVVSHPTARLVGLWLMLFGASVVPTYAWFRQALTTMLTLALVMAALSLAIDHLRTGRMRFAVGALALHAIALTFSERALAIPVVLAVMATFRHLARRPSGEAGWRSVSGWRRVGVLLLPHVVVNLAFLSVYVGGDFDKAEGSRPGPLDAVLKIGRWVVVDLLPSFLGGPLAWRPGIRPYSFAATPLPLTVLSAVLSLVALVVLWRHRRTLHPAWPVVLGALAYAVPILGLVYVGRLAQVRDVTAIDDLRLLPDVAAAAALSLAALLGAVLDARPASSTRDSGSRRRWSSRLVVAFTAAVVTFTAISWVGFGVRWHRSPVTPYLATMTDAVAGSRQQILPTALPAAVVPAWVDPELTTEPLLRLLRPDVLRTVVAADPLVVTSDGTLGRARFSVVGSATIPDGFCGRGLPVGVRSTRLELTSAASYYRGSIVSVGLLVGDAVRLDLSVVDRDGRVHGPLVDDPPELLRGPHRIQALVPHGVVVKAIIVEAVTPNTDGVCVTSAQVATVAGPR